MKNVTITGTGNFEKSNSYNLNGEDNPVLRTQYADLSIIGTAIPTTAVNITGVVLQYNTTSQLIPISMDATTSLDATTQEVEFIYDNATIYNLTNGTITLYNMTGARIIESEGNIDMNSLPKGIYLVRTAKNVTKIVR